MSEFPVQTNPVPVDGSLFSACDQTRTLAYAPTAEEARRTTLTGVVLFGALAAAGVGLATLHPTGWLLTVVGLWFVVELVRKRSPADHRQAVTPDGVFGVGGAAFTPWDDIDMVGLFVQEDEQSTRWGFGLLRPAHARFRGIELLGGASPRDIAAGQRTAWAAWLVGAVPPHVPCVVAPPADDHPSLARFSDLHRVQALGGYGTPEAIRAAHLDGATLAPVELHGAGLGRLDRLLDDPEQLRDAQFDRRHLR
jgi:hypothetical protein